MPIKASWAGGAGWSPESSSAGSPLPLPGAGLRWAAAPAHWTQTICLNADPAAVVACDPSPQFISHTRRSLEHPAVTFVVAGAGDLPRIEGGFDAVASGLVLNFIPGPAEAVREMSSRLRPGGMLAAYVWDYAGGMPFPPHLLGDGAGAGCRGRRPE